MPQPYTQQESHTPHPMPNDLTSAPWNVAHRHPPCTVHRAPGPCAYPPTLPGPPALPVTRSTGASSSSKASSIMTALISLPTPHCGHPSSTLIILCVFFTLARSVSRSSGLMERRLITWREGKAVDVWDQMEG